MKKLLSFAFLLGVSLPTAQGKLMITGIMDGPFPGGLPKVIELYAYEDIENLSEYTLAKGVNGNALTECPGGGNHCYTLPPDPAPAGTYIFIAHDQSSAMGFEDTFGFPPTYIDNVANFNGDDAMVLFEGTDQIDTYGIVGVDGNGEVWDYLDSYAYRTDGTGPDSAFNGSNWVFGGANLFDGMELEEFRATVQPIFGTYERGDEDPLISLKVDPGQAAEDAGADAATGTITLPAPASGDVVVTLSSDDDGTEISIPSEVTVADGETTATFGIEALDDSTFDGDVDILLSASAEGYRGDTFVFTVTDVAQAPKLVINEFYAGDETSVADANSDGDIDGQDQFIELVNNGPDIVDLSGWTVNIDGEAVYGFVQTSLNPGESIVVFAGGDIATFTGLFGNSQVRVAAETDLGLGSATMISVFGNSAIISEVSVSDASAITSRTRSPDLTGNFVDHTGAGGSEGAPFSPGATVEGQPFTGSRYQRLVIELPTTAVAEGESIAGTLRRYTAAGNEAELEVSLTALPGGEVDFSPDPLVIPAGVDSIPFTLEAVADGDPDGDRLVELAAFVSNQTPPFFPYVKVIEVLDGDLPRLSLSLSPSEVAEDAGDDAAMATVGVNTAPTSDLVVAVQLAGDDDEVAAPGTVTIPSGETSATFTINVIEDGEVDPDLPITISIAADGYIGDTKVLTVLNVDVFTIVVNEIHADPDGDNVLGDANNDGTRDATQDEFLEFVNIGRDPLDISGWRLFRGTHPGNLQEKHVFPDGSALDPGQALVLFGGGTPTGSFGGAIVQTASTEAITLGNSGSVLVLQDLEGREQYTVAYGPEGGNNQSLNLSPELIGQEYVRHTELVAGVLYSPGTRANGDAFELTLDAFVEWLIVFFGENYDELSVAAADADPDGDGLANLLEYAFGISPTDIEGALEARPTVEAAPGGITVTYRRPTGGAEGIEYSILAGSDLDDLQTLVEETDYTLTTTPVDGEGIEMVKVTLSERLSARNSLFIALEVERQ